MKFKHLNMLSTEKDEFSSLYWEFVQLVKYHLLRAGHNMLFPTWSSLTNASSSPFCPTGDTVCGCHQFRCADFHSKATAVKISLLSDLASSTLAVTVERTVVLKGSDPKNICTALCQPRDSNCAFNLKLHSVRNL